MGHDDNKGTGTIREGSARFGDSVVDFTLPCWSPGLYLEVQSPRGPLSHIYAANLLIRH